jgi:hypothetical protein
MRAEMRIPSGSTMDKSANWPRISRRPNEM